MKPGDQAATLAKGLEVLGCFEATGGPLAMPDIARRTGFDRAVVRRLCLTLEATGHLARDGAGFRLAPRVLALGGGYLAGLRVGRLVQPVLRQAAEALDLEVALATRDRLQALYVDRAAPARARVTLGLAVGSSLPLLHTAVGRMLLARAEPAVIEAALAARPARPFTEATVMDPERLRAAIEAARAQGYAHARDEFEPGAAGVAVPLGGLGGEFVLATTGSANRFEGEGALDRVLDGLRAAALAIGPLGG